MNDLGSFETLVHVIPTVTSAAIGAVVGVIGSFGLHNFLFRRQRDGLYVALYQKVLLFEEGIKKFSNEN